MTIFLPPSGSFWLADSNTALINASLDEVDVLVIGGGIAGITTAYLLKKTGLRVGVIEARKLFSGTTGNTTAKVTVQHGVIYNDLENISPEITKDYYFAQQSAFQWLHGEIADLAIECDFEIKDNYIYGSEESHRRILQKEYESQLRAGLEVELLTDTDDLLPFETFGALRAPDQAQFHPVKWLSGLVERIVGEGSYVAESVRALKVEEFEDHCLVDTTRGQIRAGHVVVATHVPFGDKGKFTNKMTPVADLVVAGEVDPEYILDGMYLGVGETTSLRFIPDGNRTLALVLGQKHNPGSGENLYKMHEELAIWAVDVLGLNSIEYRWSAMDYTAMDRIPYIGRYTKDSKRHWVATGFGQWGMTNGTFAGMLLTELITMDESEYEKTFSPERFTVNFKSMWSLAKGAGRVGKGHIRSNSPDHDGVNSGIVVQEEDKKVAIYTDEDGNEKKVSAICTIKVVSYHLITMKYPGIVPVMARDMMSMVPFFTGRQLNL